MRIQNYSAVGRGRSRSAFTLMEIMVVVAILVILASVAAVGVFKYIEDAKEGVARSNANAIAKAMQAYKVKYDEYPTSLDQLVSPPSGGTGYLDRAALVNPWGGGYEFDPSGPTHNGQMPDVWAVRPTDGMKFSNAPREK